VQRVTYTQLGQEDMKPNAKNDEMKPQYGY